MRRVRLVPRLAVSGLAAGALAAGLLSAVAAPAAADGGLSLSPSAVGQNSSTVIQVTGSGFGTAANPSVTAVNISGCPATNPGANYPVPFVDAPAGKQGSVSVVNDTTLLLTTPAIIPAGVCDIAVTTTSGTLSLADGLTFQNAPERLTIQLTNNSGVYADSDVWVTLGYTCSNQSPPPGAGDCSTDGDTDPNYAWPKGGPNPLNRWFYEAYNGGAPLPAFTGVQLSSLQPVAGQPRTYSFEIANIDSGVVYLSYGQAVNTGADEAGRAPSYITNTTRFDVFELTFHGSGASADDQAFSNQVYANITAVSGLGILMGMTGTDNSYGTPQVVGAPIEWGTTLYGIYSQMQSEGADVTNQEVVKTSNSQDASGSNFLRFISPSTNTGVGYADFGSGTESYLQWLDGASQPMTIVDQYTGQVGPGSATWFCYQGRFQYDDTTTLSGGWGFASQADAVAAAQNGCSGGTPGPDMQTTVTSQDIYMQPSEGFTLVDYTSQGNDIFSAIYRNFIVSFAYGYWGSQAGESGAPDPGFNTAYWLNRPGTPAQPAFGAAWSGQGVTTDDPRWNAYAAAIWNISNVYGMPYSDTFDNAGKGNPQVTGPNVYNLSVVLNPDGQWGSTSLTSELAINGERVVRKGRHSIRIVGVAAGFAEGTLVRPWVRIHGKHPWRPAATAVRVGPDGAFTWSRKVGRKAVVSHYMEAIDTRSNVLRLPHQR